MELFLNYCVRFYDRQFITGDNMHQGILERFEKLVNDFFTSDKPQSVGLPYVTYCAGELNLSANYFGDLIKKETGKSAQEYIQMKVIDVAKERIFDLGKSISEIAYDLGFRSMILDLDIRNISHACSNKRLVAHQKNIEVRLINLFALGPRMSA